MKQIYLFNLLSLFVSFSFLNAKSDPIRDSLQSITTTKEENSLLNQLPSDNFFVKLETKTSEVLKAKKNFQDAEFTWANVLEETKMDSLIDKNKSIKLAKATFRKLERKGNFVDNFQDIDPKDLPVGKKSNLGNLEYTIGISKIEIFDDYAEAEIFAKVKLPKTDQNGTPIEIFFGASKVKLSNNKGIREISKLVLLENVPIPNEGGKWMLTLNGDFDYTNGDFTGLTYLEMDNKGIKEFQIDASIEFSRSLVLPIDSNTAKVDTREEIDYTRQVRATKQTTRVPNRVRGNFNINAKDWNDILAEIQLQPFVRTSKANSNNTLQFYSEKVIVDLSDSRNADINFPAYYTENALLSPSAESWRGVYFNSLEVKLPKVFKKRQSTEAISISANDFLIDGYGVSGSFRASNLIPLSEGSTNKVAGWAMSLDQIEVELAANQLISASFDGQIQLPIVSNNASSNENGGSNFALGYNGIWSDDEYLLKANLTQEPLPINMWKAKMIIEKGSYIEMKVEDDEFLPKAYLNGRMDISGNMKADESFVGSEKISKDKLINFKGITFRGLQLQTKGQKIAVE